VFLKHVKLDKPIHTSVTPHDAVLSRRACIKDECCLVYLW